MLVSKNHVVDSNSHTLSLIIRVHLTIESHLSNISRDPELMY